MSQPQKRDRQPSESSIFIRLYGFEHSNATEFLPIRSFVVLPIDADEPLATLSPGLVIHSTSRPCEHRETCQAAVGSHGTLECYDWSNFNRIMTFQAHDIPPVESSGITTQEKFFLKVAPYADANRLENDSSQMFLDKLRHEAHDYKLRLSSVQGKAVPRHYGVWVGRLPNNIIVLVSIMQWGGLPYFTEVNEIRYGDDEAKQAALKAYYALHKTAGVQHQSTSMLEHSFYLLYNEDLKQAFIVNFTCADFNHKCRLRMQLQSYESPPSLEEFGCAELLDALISLRMITWSKMGNKHLEDSEAEICAAHESASLEEGQEAMSGEGEAQA